MPQRYCEVVPVPGHERCQPVHLRRPQSGYRRGKRGGGQQHPDAAKIGCVIDTVT